MQSSNYLQNEIVDKRINEIITNSKDSEVSDQNLKNLIGRIIIETFNDGVISNLSTRKQVSEMTLKQKSKEITGFLPSHFKKSETGKKLGELIMNEISANTTDYVLNIGYETVLQDVVDKALQVAYSVGITTGFEIATDAELKDIYTTNVERFMKSGSSGAN